MIAMWRKKWPGILGCSEPQAKAWPQLSGFLSASVHKIRQPGEGPSAQAPEKRCSPDLIRTVFFFFFLHPLAMAGPLVT